MGRPKTAPRRFVPPSGKGSPEWYTPGYIIEAAREVMGGIDCDPASCAIAQETVKASVYYTKEDDGLTKPWHGRVWLNPPYGAKPVAAFNQKLISEIADGKVLEAVIFVCVSPKAGWLKRLRRQATAFCYFDKGVDFYNGDGETNVPFFDSLAAYLGPRAGRFAQVFSQFGAIEVPYQPQGSSAGPQWLAED